MSPTGQYLQTLVLGYESGPNGGITQGAPSWISDLLIDGAGNIDAVGSILSSAGRSLMRFSSSGMLLSATPTNGPLPTSIVADASGNLYVSSVNGTTAGRYTSNGTYLGTFASGLTSASALAFVPNPVPEPTTFAALAFGAVALIRRRRR